MSEPTELLDSVVDAPTIEAAARPKRRFVRTALTALVLFALGVALTTVRLPYLVLEPGDTFETETFIDVEGLEVYPSPEGEVRFVTVTQRRLTPVGWVISSLSDSDQVFHEDELLRGRTIEEQREENAQLMLSSQSTAIMAALVELGYEVAEPVGVVVIDVVDGGQLAGVMARNDVISAVNGQSILTYDELYEAIDAVEIGSELTLTVRTPGQDPRNVTVTLTDDTAGFLGVARATAEVADGRGARIDDVVAGGPVEDVLEPGDRIIEVDGSPIEDFDGLIAALSGLRSGDDVDVTVLRGSGDDEQSITVDVRLGSRVTDRAGIANAGTQFRDAELPFEIDILTEEIGGPSAGLAFTLTILDVLTPGELTGGTEIVVTGTIDPAGNVGPIGGVHQKAHAARSLGAALFIVPEANLAEARAAVDDIRIEGVSTLDEALAIIADFGGNALELPDDGQLHR